MGDKRTFDGFYMWSHDRGFNGVRRFIDGNFNSPGYLYSKPLSGAGGFGASTNVYGGAAGGNSAGDGDVDVALALLVAYMQWGEFSGIVPAATGVEINYKNEAMAYIRGIADTVRNNTIVPAEFGSGDIGLDGYMKGGDTWRELTPWATPGYMGMIPEYNGGTQQHIDYYAPSYFRSFADWMQSESVSPWCQSQYRRAEASSDWLMGQMRAQNLIAHAGWVSFSGATPVFSNFDQGEDFRTAWRTILNYVWNGNPTTSWDPTTHQVVAGGNTYERDMGIFHANFMKNPQALGNSSITLAGYPITFCGPITMQQQYNPNGSGGSGFRLNWMHGVGAPAAIASQDFDLMAQLYRQCEITWDANMDVSQQYLTSRPRYFHEWFRLMGMMILTGNYHDPLDMVAGANMKVYKAVNKTYAYPGDTLTYTISYRNYGKLNASNVVITDALNAGYTFISSDKPISVSGQNLTWNLGTVTGMNAGNLNLTRDSIKLKVLVNTAATGRICNQATITCSNGTGWTSNEYPNKVSEVMERNCVDILTDKPLEIRKTASKSLVSVGDTLSYTIVVKNKPVDFLNGGRQNVNILFGHQGLSAASSEVKLNFRILHGADEAYINYKNYRVSYFLNETPTPTWALATSINEGFSGQLPTLTQQSLTPGTGYNHRFMLTFPNQIATVTPYILNYNGPVGVNYIHRGSMETARMEVRVFNPSFANANWTDDWSADNTLLVASGDAYHPVANNWTDPLAPNLPVTKVHRDACGTITKTTDKILAEEWDGYTWRRIYGNAPVSGRELNNIRVTDTLPDAVTFAGFFPGFPAGSVIGNSITWPAISQLKTNDSVVYKFWVTVKNAAYFNCPSGPTPGTFTNTGYARANNEPLSQASATTTVSCAALPPPETSLDKTANAASYSIGNTATYTLRYNNTNGSTYNKPSSMLAADWTNRVSTTNISATAINTIGNNNSILTNDYAHGTNGTVSFTVDPHQYATFGIALRNSGGASFASSLFVTFKYQNATVDITLWNGITAVSTVSIAGTWVPPLAGAATFNHKLEITGTNLRVFMVDMVTPVHTFSSLPITGPGWVGIINGTPSNNDSYGTHIITNWNSRFDSAFDLTITDPIPAEITYGSASNATYNAINYTGSNAAGTVTWQTIPGPILANSVIDFVWNGTVSSCPNGSILNIGYASVYGITPNAQSQVSASCSGALPVSWLYFEAHRNGNDVDLFWSGIEENNQEFSVERSVDGISYTTLKTLASLHGNGAGSYHYLDQHVGTGAFYYRIKQTDVNGNFSFSPVRKVSNHSEFSVTPFPVPVSNTLGLKVTGTENSIEVKILNVLGQTSGVYFFEKTNLVEIPFEHAPGTYMIVVVSGEDVFRATITKE
jgi:uncharacterized repeat protein (TIGR01451 family)